MIKKGLLLGTLISSNFAAQGPDMYSNQLLANFRNQNTIIAQKGQKEGEDDLKRMAKTSILEEMYAFFPNQNKWVELGYNERMDGLNYNKERLKNEFKKDPNVELYHIHTQNSIDSEISKLDSAYSKSGIFADNQDMQNGEIEIKAHMAIPSTGDLYSLIEDAKELTKINPVGKIRHNVVTPTSVVSYELKRNPEDVDAARASRLTDGLLSDSKIWSYKPVESRRIKQLTDYFNSRSRDIVMKKK